MDCTFFIYRCWCLCSNQPVHKSICFLWTRNERFFGLGMGGLIRLITLESSEFSQKMDVLAGSTSRHTVCHPRLEKSFFTTFGHSLHQLSSRSSEILVCYILTVVFSKYVNNLWKVCTDHVSPHTKPVYCLRSSTFATQSASYSET